MYLLGTAFTAYNVTGTFSLGERLKFNGEDTDGRTLTDQTAYETSDVQSVYSIVGSLEHLLVISSHKLQQLLVLLPFRLM